MLTGTDFAMKAQSDEYTGIPYSKLDCQAFVERVLRDAGCRNTAGNAYNWRGSNSMWRNALSWKGTLAECYTKFGRIPLGAWVFIVKDDGGEKDRGYNDNAGNASHVGIYCRDDSDPVRDSTKTKSRDGVGYRKLDGFTHVGLCKYISYDGTNSEEEALKAIEILRNYESTGRQVLSALVTIKNYLKGM